MAYLGPRSNQNIATCTIGIQDVVKTAIALDIMDLCVLEGHRGETLQNLFFDEGKSKVKYPASKHNKMPSKAVDIAPWVNGKVSWDKAHCIHLAGILLATAAFLGKKWRWGGNWDMDREPVTDQDFQDLVHFEEV